MGENMNREIRYRCWNPVIEKMLDVMSLSIKDGEVKRITAKEVGVEDILKDGWFDLKDGDEKKVHLMQFTGLLDENGKEIFEGDILGFGDTYEVLWNDNDEHVEGTGWCVKRLELNKYNKHDYSHLWCMTSLPEIIGNIYENPDLLTTNT